MNLGSLKKLPSKKLLFWEVRELGILKDFLGKNLGEKLREAIVERVYSPPDVWLDLIRKAEPEGWLRYHKKVILRNFELARKNRLPMCQDTGYFQFLVKLKPEFVVEWSHRLGSYGRFRSEFEEFLDSVVRDITEKTYLRSSIMIDPLRPSNSGDNTPSFVSFEVSDENSVNFVMKGGGSENGTMVETLPPSRGIDGIKEFLVNWAEKKAVGVCPPLYVSLVVGGTVEKALILSRRMLLEPPPEKFGFPDFSEEGEEFRRILEGVLGKGYVVAFVARKLPRHIASMPVAVSVFCNAWRVGKVNF